MILSGEKPEEYREIKTHWKDRLTTLSRKYNNWHERIKKFDQVEFTNGYSPSSLKATFECKGIEIRTGNPNWGAEPDKNYFVIKLGKEISRENNTN